MSLKGLKSLKVPYTLTPTPHTLKTLRRYVQNIGRNRKTRNKTVPLGTKH